MELKLAAGESIIKSWDYAVSGYKRERSKVESNLLVTNKRIISTLSSKSMLKRNEIPLKSAKAVNGWTKKNNSPFVNLQLVFGIIFCCTIIGLLIGIPMIKSALAKKRACIFKLSIITSGSEGSELALGATAAGEKVTRRHFFSKRGSFNEFRVNVDKEMAREIIDELGAIILENSEQ